MFRVYAHEYIALGESIHDLRVLFYGKDTPWTEEEKRSVVDQLGKLLEHAKNLELIVSADLISRRLGFAEPLTSLEAYDLLIDAIRSELRSKLFVYIPSRRATYFETVPAPGVEDAFPSASKEIVAACSCLAAALYTASVFHSMRAAEIGVRAMGIELGVTFPYDISLADWQNILDQIESKIKAMKDLLRSEKKDSDQRFFSEAATQFRYFKDGWRVRVTHARETYDELQAIKVVDHVKDFFETLAERLKEPV
jgi:HEPN domain